MNALIQHYEEESYFGTFSLPTCYIFRSTSKDGSYAQFDNGHQYPLIVFNNKAVELSINEDIEKSVVH